MRVTLYIDSLPISLTGKGTSQFLDCVTTRAKSGISLKVMFSGDICPAPTKWQGLPWALCVHSHLILTLSQKTVPSSLFREKISHFTEVPPATLMQNSVLQSPHFSLEHSEEKTSMMCHRVTCRAGTPTLSLSEHRWKEVYGGLSASGPSLFLFLWWASLKNVKQIQEIIERWTMTVICFLVAYLWTPKFQTGPLC